MQAILRDKVLSALNMEKMIVILLIVLISITSVSSSSSPDVAREAPSKSAEGSQRESQTSFWGTCVSHRSCAWANLGEIQISDRLERPEDLKQQVSSPSLRVCECHTGRRNPKSQTENSNAGAALCICPALPPCLLRSSFPPLANQIADLRCPLTADEGHPSWPS